MIFTENQIHENNESQMVTHISPASTKINPTQLSPVQHDEDDDINLSFDPFINGYFLMDKNHVVLPLMSIER